MIVSCTSCNCKYKLDSAVISFPKKVRCTKCGNIWVVHNDDNISTIEAAPIMQNDMELNQQHPHDEDKLAEESFKNENRDKTVSNDKQSKTSLSAPLCISIFLLILVTAVYCLKSVLISNLESFFEHTYIENIIKATKKPTIQIDNLSQTTLNNTLSISGRVFNNLDKTLSVKHLKFYVTYPSVNAFFQGIISNPKTLLFVLTPQFIKLDKTLFRPGESCNFSINIEVPKNLINNSLVTLQEH